MAKRTSKRLILGKKNITDVNKNVEEKTNPLSARLVHIKVKKKAGTIKKSSRLWLERQLNDPYVWQAKMDGYRSRAAYKLIEINNKYKFLEKGQKIVDIGSAPGGWSQVASKIVGSSEEKKLVAAIDLLPIEYIKGVNSLQMDFLDPEAKEWIIDSLQGNPDVVMSDMAAATTGHRRTDHYRTMHLCEMAAEFAIEFLCPQGHFLSKTFQGGAESGLLAKLQKHFSKIHHVKPPSSRPESVELYILALDFKGRK